MILGILQARMSSTRLPGKVMLPLAGAPMLARQIERLVRARNMDKLVLATSDAQEDDVIDELARAASIQTYRGSLRNVLDRYYRAAKPHQPTHIVRLTADCPLADWDVIDACVRFTVEGGYDYASNTLNPTWPDGLDVEVFTFEALEMAWRGAQNELEREHVTPFMKDPHRFVLGSFENSIDLGRLRWTVDERRDYEFVEAVYDALYPTNPTFTTSDVLRLLRERPELVLLNAGIERNEAFRRAQESGAGPRNGF